MSKTKPQVKAANKRAATIRRRAAAAARMLRERAAWRIEARKQLASLAREERDFNRQSRADYDAATPEKRAEVDAWFNQ